MAQVDSCIKNLPEYASDIEKWLSKNSKAIEQAKEDASKDDKQFVLGKLENLFRSSFYEYRVGEEASGLAREYFGGDTKVLKELKDGE